MNLQSFATPTRDYYESRYCNMRPCFQISFLQHAALLTCGTREGRRHRWRLGRINMYTYTLSRSRARTHTHTHTYTHTHTMTHAAATTNTGLVTCRLLCCGISISEEEEEEEEDLLLARTTPTHAQAPMHRQQEEAQQQRKDEEQIERRSGGSWIERRLKRLKHATTNCLH